MSESIVVVSIMFFRLLLAVFIISSTAFSAPNKSRSAVSPAKKTPIATVQKKASAKIVRVNSSKHLKTSSDNVPIAVSDKGPAEPLKVAVRDDGQIVINRLPRFLGLQQNMTEVTARGDFVFYSLDPDLQAYSEKLLSKVRAPHAAIVAMEPHSGRILAISQKSTQLKNAALHNGFPAASLFKVVTAAAAVERGGLHPLKEINFRGGTYTLNELNYRPDPGRDTLSMTASEALGKSCNPVFGRIGLEFSTPPVLRTYAKAFAYNTQLPIEAPLAPSSAYIPDDDFEYSRTSAGFGAVTLSPIHAATIMSAIANGGIMPAPTLVRKIVSPNGALLYESNPHMLGRSIHSETAQTLLGMMEFTTTMGTSRREFAANSKNALKGIRVAAKTGTLHGENPFGLNHWFIATAPLQNPKIALAIIVVDGGSIESKPSHLGRLVLEKYLLG